MGKLTKLFKNLTGSSRDGDQTSSRSYPSSPVNAQIQDMRGQQLTNPDEPPPAYVETVSDVNTPSTASALTPSTPMFFNVFSPPPPVSAKKQTFLSNDTSSIRSNLSISDDKYAFLYDFDTIFAIDDSGSMHRYWDETRQALEAVLSICIDHDRDGVDVRFFNATQHNTDNIDTVKKFKTIFNKVKPSGGTPTGKCLRNILRPYLQSYEQSPENQKPKPVNIIVITDGAATDDPESEIVYAAKKLDSYEALSYQVGIQFFQVGNDREATKTLQAMDDNISSIAKCEIRDMVDTVPYSDGNGGRLTADGIFKVILGAVQRRLDNDDSKKVHV